MYLINTTTGTDLTYDIYWPGIPSIMSCPNLRCTKSFISLLQAGGTAGLLMDLAANEKAVHSDFFNGEKILLFLIEIKMW